MKEKATIYLGTPRKLCFNVWAMEQITKKFGSLEDAEEKMTAESISANPEEGINTIIEMMVILINAEILRHNAAIKAGIETGEALPEFDLSKQEIKLFWKMEDFKRCKVIIMESMEEGYSSEIPKDEDVPEDEVLREIDNEKNVKSRGAS
ncbi:MAG: hypothetical protein JW817_03320 [Clostridiales bacterium]|jgi:hypothetical protein|nr:hypothetical protein [Clostridiales bacterium]